MYNRSKHRHQTLSSVDIDQETDTVHDDIHGRNHSIDYDEDPEDLEEEYLGSTSDNDDGLCQDQNLQSQHSRTYSRYHYRSQSCHETLQTIASVAGNVLEWYDFAVFGFFSDILGEVFFPPSQEQHQQENKIYNTTNENVVDTEYNYYNNSSSITGTYNDTFDTGFIGIDSTYGNYTDNNGNLSGVQSITVEETENEITDSFIIFGVAFLMRPVGGIIIGSIGDIKGRKYALEISIFLMAIATTCMGLLPTYNQVGDLSIVLLTLVRCCQGLSVGGQLMSSLVYTLESHPPSRWGLYGSYIMSAANFGTFLGGIVAYYLRNTLLTYRQLLEWGWRVPFLSGVVIAFCGFYLKYYCPDDTLNQTPAPTAEDHGSLPSAPPRADRCSVDDDNKVEDDEDDALPHDGSNNCQNNTNNGHNHTIGDQQQQQIGPETSGCPTSKAANSHAYNTTPATIKPTMFNPLRIAFSKQNLRPLCASALVPMIWSGGFYFSFVWLAIYMTDLITPPIPSAFGINSCNLLMLILWFPLAGILSDKFGRRHIMTIGGVLLFGFGPLLIVAIDTSSSSNPGSASGSSLSSSALWTAFISQACIGISLALWGAPMCAWLVESFDPQARLTSVAVGYNVAQAVAGGFSPVLATLIVDNIDTKAAGLLLMILSALSLTGLWLVAPPPPLPPQTLPRHDTTIESQEDVEEEVDNAISTDASSIARRRSLWNDKGDHMPLEGEDDEIEVDRGDGLMVETDSLETMAIELKQIS